MAKIKINKDGLRQNKQAIDARIQELQSLNERLAALLSRIESSWEGAASKQYITTMMMYKQKAESMIEVLNEFKNYIEQAVNQFEEKDRSGGSRIRNA